MTLSTLAVNIVFDAGKKELRVWVDDADAVLKKRKEVYGWEYNLYGRYFQVKEECCPNSQRMRKVLVFPDYSFDDAIIYDMGSKVLRAIHAWMLGQRISLNGLLFTVSVTMNALGRKPL